jgi:hypothetical protein
MLVGARHEEAVEPALLEFAAQGGKTRGASRRVALVVVVLQGFVHARPSSSEAIGHKKTA